MVEVVVHIRRSNAGALTAARSEKFGKSRRTALGDEWFIRIIIGHQEPFEKALKVTAARGAI